ncbi:nitrite/sulfite reductase, hemoprotein beta-component, ferrodoxin domain protein [Maricaulis maris MCS10]|uniref:Nitrite/sulfite reductase, hemoprotein beta-component, ferrodoxin domain protein n=1 Tax=Maricaulis maris (strain MCS10) TaxID=394221 RepID=Q0ASU9_MARMM|nr:nitrite/sulfite reductase [Maricaulis maris]ABI64638.1 nitrite/sulfite reductase, hemoprotein beta-component, ferrodoxin domain protein [Maricaulis maris MCS10]
MYKYDSYDHAMVADRIAEFRDQVTRRLDGRLTEDQFKPLRLMNGVYLQLHAYMLRVAIPYGTFNSTQMRTLAGIARDYDRGYGHFTTRQNLQYNWPALVDIPDILDRLAAVEMHAIQTSGNCIRNVTADPFAGAAADELEDGRPWAEIVRQWSSFHPEFTFLPRKFKIAVNGAKADRAGIRVHDIGLQIVRNEAGKTGFEVWVGGGQGRTPRLGQLINPFLAPEDLLSYLTACLRVYNQHGRRDNLYKARIKILVEALGAEEYGRQVEDEWAVIRDGELKLPAEEIARIRAFFGKPKQADPAPVPVTENRAFARWLDRNRRDHAVNGLSSLVISLKPIGGTPGDITDAQMDAVADLAERYGFDEIRATPDQNLILPHVRNDDLEAVWNGLVEAGLAVANAGLATDIVACPGLDYCNLANARSIPIAQAISSLLEEKGLSEKAGDVTIKIDGCINACGHHHVAHIGVLGVDKRGEEFYQITLGGAFGADAAIGSIIGKGLAGEDVPAAIARLLETYLDIRASDERFIDTLRRVGSDAFKEAIYADA